MSTKLKAGTATSGAVIDADTTGILELQSGSTPTTAVTIDASQNVSVSGNLGVGGTPTYKFQVDRPASNGVVAAFGRLSGQYSYIYADTASVYFASDSAANTAWQFNESSDYLAAWTNGTERMRIDSSGNVYVGNTSLNPVAARVNGITLQKSAQTGILVRGTNAGSYFGLDVTSGQHLNFYTDNGSAFVTAGNISSNGGTTSYNASSDYRMKENIAPMQNALSVIEKLKPVTYQWKDEFAGTRKEGQGFIAHELQEVCPEAVTGEKDAVDEEGNPIYQGIDTSFLVATLTAAIQELNAKVEALEAQLGAK